MPMRLLTCCLLLLASLSSWAQLNNPAKLTPYSQPAAQFLPVDQAFQLQPEFFDGTLYLNWRITDGYYLYKHQFQFSAVDGDQRQPLQATLPTGLASEDDYFGPVEIYYQQASVKLGPLPDQPFTLAVTSQGCADAGLCYPPQTAYFVVDSQAQTVDASIAAASTSPKPVTDSAPASKPGTLALMALLAFCGGLILNLMPCVFPVLSLKVLGFAHDHQHSQAVHGLSYGAGVVISFIAVALLLLSLRDAGQAVGWGFHLQSPWFVALLAYLFFVMGLSLSGLVEFGGNWMNVGSSLTRISGYHGSFFTGVLATVVASPCTAPFMGSALGFAATQPANTALLIFVALGLGMATPVMLLSCSPRLLRAMPKPGAWMEHFKQLLAFPLYATAVWLCWVVGKQTGVNGMTAVLSGCVILALALWLWNGGKLRRIACLLSAALALSLLASPLLQQQRATAEPDASWLQYSPSKLTELQQQGQPVFLNVTADWCITCLANEKLVLGRDDLQQAMTERGINYMKADWTNYDPAITELLARFDRNGIPLYVFFPADRNSPPQVLPQLLSLSTLEQAFDR